MDSVFGHAAWLSKELGQPNLSQVMNLWVQELNHAWFNHIYETIYSTTLEWYIYGIVILVIQKSMMDLFPENSPTTG